MIKTLFNNSDDKNSDDYLIAHCDTAIAELVFDKVSLVKAFNYYHGVRDRFQFAHLEHNYGIGNPTSIEFIPLVRKHIDALVGEYLSTNITPKISCKDKGTLTNMFRDKQLAISGNIAKLLKTHLTNAMYSALKGDNSGKAMDADISKQLQEVSDSTDRNFISEYEIAAQNIITYLMNSRDVDFKNKMKDLIIDLLIAGETYFQVVPTSGGTNIDIQIENPLNTFVDRDFKSVYMKKGYRSVIRRWMTKSEILVKYGDKLTSDDIKELDSVKPEYSSNNLMLINAVNSRTGTLLTDGIMAGVEATPMYNQYSAGNLKLLPVFEVEWIDADLVRGKKPMENRYSVVRIGASMYILDGKDEDVMRSIDTPNECNLRVNGMYYTDRTGTPYSLMLATANLQDKYDILNFFKDNAIATSGAMGSHVDVAHLPEFLGNTMPERLVKYLAYKKSGIAPFDSSQEGQVINQTFAGYDDTIKVTTIQAIQLAIQNIEETASSITGVFRERLGGIEQRDAVQNIEMGMQMSYVITKQYYQGMDTLVREILTDSLNVAKKVFKKGITGSTILGDNRRQLFTALPEHYTVTDFDVHIIDSGTVIKEQELIKQIAMELTKGGQFDPEMLVIISTSKSLTEMKENVLEVLKAKKAENGQLQQMNQALQQAQQAQQQAQKDLQTATTKLSGFNDEDIKLKAQELQQKNNLENRKLDINSSYNDSKLEWEQKRVQLEGIQLFDISKQNDKVRQD
jgi:hypothetical protein